MAKAPSDTKTKDVAETAIPMHKRLAMGQNVETGAGKGAGATGKPTTRS